MDPVRARRWGLFLLALHLAWRAARYFADFPLWGDEAFVALNLDDRDCASLFMPLEYGQIAPWGWLCLMDLVREGLSPETWALRLPAFLAGIASALLTFRLCFRLAPGAGGLLGFAIFAASYYPMRHGAELKPYAFDLLWALLLTSAALALLEPRPRRCAWLGLAAAAWLGPWISFPSLFVTAAVLAVLGWRASRAGAWRTLAALAGIGAPWALTALWMLTQYAAPHAAAASWLTEMAMWTPAFPPLAQPWEWPWWLLQAHAGYMSAYPTGGRDFGSAATLLLILLGLWTWRPPLRAALLGLLLGGLAFNFAAALFEKYPYGGSVRTSIAFAPAFCLLAGLGLARVLTALRAPRAGPAVACLALAAMPVGGIAEDLTHPYKIEADRNCERFVAEMAARIGPEDAVIGFVNSQAGSAAPDWHGLGGSAARLRWMLRRALPQPVDWNGPPQRAPRVWLLVYADDNDTAMPFPARDFDAMLTAWSAALGDARLVQSVTFGRAESAELYLFTPPATR